MHYDPKTMNGYTVNRWVALAGAPVNAYAYGLNAPLLQRHPCTWSSIRRRALSHKLAT